MTRTEILRKYPNLSNADLSDADLSNADLYGADLRNANLRNADLRGADLRGASLRDAKGLLTLATPPEKGAFIAYKKLSNGTVAELRIPAQAKRTGSYVGRKCRAKFVDVRTGRGPSRHNPRVTYARGKRVKSDSYNPDPRVECTHGIHFFMTRQEAEDYDF